MGVIAKIGAAALLLPVAFSAPIEKRALTDADILQFALTLEHLENVFYKSGLEKFPESDFLAAGYSSEYYNNLKYIAHDEEQHVLELSSALMAAGAVPQLADTYDFGYTDPKSFVALASVLEGVGDAAYLGAAPAIMEKAYLGVAGSILVTEALHTAVHRIALGEVAAANPYGSAIIPNAAYTAAAQFITAANPANAALPFMAFPTLMATQGIPSAPGLMFTFSTTAAMPAEMFITFCSGLETISMPATMEGGMISAMIPLTVSGQSYAFLTNANVTMLTDSAVVAGPAILEVTPDAPTYDITIM